MRRRGEEVAVRDGRPNGELLLATGAMEDDNPADCLIVQVSRPVHEDLPCGKQPAMSVCAAQACCGSLSCVVH